MKLTGVCLYTRDLEPAVVFYRDTLGLKLKEHRPDRYASFELDGGQELGLKVASADREVPGAGTIFVASADAKADSVAAQAKHLTFYKELHEAPWAITFSILDPDGNKIEYMQRKPS
jgi:catechol 2,3-dioxygenase-like lactoylglutathione lyase family enzyme